ncbi:hypothetical protein CCMA1212_008688 [Trichoderma ghanense]|uniref:Uncharacterized protein n=1 Tax=Trichoderma ghanense TaxID=65468 RepID=A0ABY2GUB7_9HYPO
MARNAPKQSSTSQQQQQHPPPAESNVDAQLSTRIITDPNTGDDGDDDDDDDDGVSRKRRKTSKSAEQGNAAAGPRDHQPPQPTSNQPAPLLGGGGPSQYIDPHVFGQGAGPTPTEKLRRMQAGGESSDTSRRDWAQPGAGKGSSLGSNMNAPSTPKPPLLSQHAAGVKTATKDDQNITSLTSGEGSKKGQKRRLSFGQSDAEFDQERLLNIVQELDKFEKEQKDFGKQQLQAIREGSV